MEWNGNIEIENVSETKAYSLKKSIKLVSF